MSFQACNKVIVSCCVFLFEEQDKEEEKQVSTEFTPLLQDDNEDKMDKMLCENVRTNGLTILQTNLNFAVISLKE